jgi:signal transduction histidine kinase
MDETQIGARWPEQPGDLAGAGLPGLAHDLKSWLTPVKSCLQLWEAGETEKALALRAHALENLHTVLHCLEALRQGHTATSPAMQPVRLRGLLAQAAAQCAAFSLEKQNQILLAPGPEVEILGDEWLLRRLFLNLLVNALQAASAASPIHIDLRLPAAPNPHVLIVFQNSCAPDTAAAAPEEALRPRLGLRISHEICRLHQGEMDIRCDDTAQQVTVELRFPLPPPGR